MTARLVALASLAVAAACTRAPGLAPRMVPVGQLAGHAAQCAGKDGFSDPAPPLAIYGNVYDVGTCGIIVLLVTGDAGHILIDGGPAEAAPLVAANIDRLGFALRDVKWIVSSHEHFDHVGALAELQRRSGAKVAALASAAAVFVSGKSTRDDPQFERLPAFAPLRVDRRLSDGEVLALGSLRLTAHATPGHAPGSTSWTLRACERRDCRAIAYADSVNSTADDHYRFTDHPAYVAAFRSSLDKIAALDCDILVTPHPSASALFERLMGTKTLFDSAGCKAYAAAGRQRLDARLAEEAARK